MKNVKTCAERFDNPIARELPCRRYYTMDEVAWLTRMPERVVRENIMLSRLRS